MRPIIRDVLDGIHKTQAHLREHIALTGPIYVLARGSVRVSYSRAAIICEAGHEHRYALIGRKPTESDALPLVQLACRQAARLRLGIQPLSPESEDEFLASCAPIGKRPESRVVQAKRADRGARQTLPGRTKRAA